MGNKLLLKASKGAAGRKGAAASLPAEFTKKFPYLAAFLTEEVDAEDRPRDLSRVTVFVDAGAVKACISDPTQAATLYVTIREPGGAFAALESALASDEPDWRSWPNREKKGRGGK